MRNAGLEEAQAGIKFSGRNINNLRYADDTTLMAESEELKSLLMKVKEESEKVGFKLNIQKIRITASGPITSWQIDGETVETVADFVFLGSKITADCDFSHEIKRHLLLVLCPMSESPSGKREGFQDNATGKKGKFITDLSQGSLPHPKQWCGSESPKPKLLHKFIG